MKSIFILIVILSCSILAQDRIFNKDLEIQKFIDSGGKIEEISHEVYKFIYSDGNARIFNFNRNDRTNEKYTSVDTTIINMWEIDTTKYNNRFSFWQKVDIYNVGYYQPPLIDDLNRNNIPEIYGRHNLDGPVEIYERKVNGIFESIYAYTDSGTLGVNAMGEVHGSGEKEIYIWHRNYYSGVVFRSDSISLLPTTFDFIFNYEIFGQVNDMTFGDFDKNQITDAVFNADFGKIVISEFRDSLNNFNTIFEKITSDTTQFNAPSGFAIGDFDNDSKIELIAGSTQGIIYSIEAIDENLYEVNWQGDFSTPNAYMNTSTNDIDDNGNPEFWIGGMDISAGITRFQAYEAASDNVYKTVAIIELRYIVSLSSIYIQAEDLDGDGTEELIISLGNFILILKFTGSINSHKYEIYYAKFGEATQPGAEFEPLSLADLDGDNKTDLLLSMDKWENGQTIIFSYILRNNGTTGVEPSGTNIIFPEDHLVSYPVPFNSVSTINFIISKESSAKIKVFNSLGKEIEMLLDENISPGEYSIQWKAEDKNGNPLPSGIYFISLQTENVVKTVKTILLK